MLKRDLNTLVIRCLYCDKICYSEEDATKVALSLSFKTQKKYNAYYCPHCKHWHVGQARTAEEKDWFVFPKHPKHPKLYTFSWFGKQRYNHSYNI